jgi:hypothetical protein
MGTKEADPLSIMCYQLPGSIMKNGKPIKGGTDINPNDFAFAKSLYPKHEHAPESVATTPILTSPIAEFTVRKR